MRFTLIPLATLSIVLAGCAEQPVNVQEQLKPAYVCQTTKGCGAAWARAKAQLQRITRTDLSISNPTRLQTWPMQQAPYLLAMAKLQSNQNGTYTIKSSFVCQPPKALSDTLTEEQKAEQLRECQDLGVHAENLFNTVVGLGY